MIGTALVERSAIAAVSTASQADSVMTSKVNGAVVIARALRTDQVCLIDRPVTARDRDGDADDEEDGHEKNADGCSAALFHRPPPV